jgi:hypothetical protein
MDDATQDRLQECVRRESRSLLQYVHKAPLWAGPKERPALERLRSMAQAELNATDALASWLQKQRAGIPHLGPFPSGFLNLNDSAYRHVLPTVVREQVQLLGELEADAAAIAEPGAKTLLETMLSLKRAHQAELSTVLASTNSVAH